MQTADRTAMAGIVAGLAGAVMTALFEKVFPNAPVWIWQSLFASSVIVLAFSLAFLADEHLCRPRFKRTIVGPGLLIILSSLGFIAGIAWALTGKVPLLAASPNPAHATSPIAVVLLPSAGQMRLHNNGNEELSLWGDKLEGYPASIENEARKIAPGYYYYFLYTLFTPAMRAEIGENGQKLKRFEVYLSDEQQIRWIARFDLLVTMKNGEIEVHTQQLGIIKGDWMPP
jgi:hypothetical protein